MTTLRDKARGINQEAFQNGKSLGIMASYLHKDVKVAVLEFEKYLKDDRTLLETAERKFKEIFGDFEK